MLDCLVLGRYIDYLSIFEETITLETLPQCLTAIEKKLPGSLLEISKGIVQCDAAFQRHIGYIVVFNIEELRKFLQLRGNVTHIESHTGCSSLLTYIKPVLRVVKSDSLWDPPQVSSCMTRSSLRYVLEEYMVRSEKTGNI